MSCQLKMTEVGDGHGERDSYKWDVGTRNLAFTDRRFSCHTIRSDSSLRVILLTFVHVWIYLRPLQAEGI